MRNDLLPSTLLHSRQGNLREVSHRQTLAELELKGGQVKLVFDTKAKKLRVVSEFKSVRKLTAAELRELIDDTQGQWSDGIGEGCFDSVMDKRKSLHRLGPGHEREGKSDSDRRRDARTEENGGQEDRVRGAFRRPLSRAIWTK